MPSGFQVGPIFIRFYGIVLMVGAIAGAWLAEREARRRDKDPEFIWDALIWVIIAGIVGARIWHIFTPPPSMVEVGITTSFYLTHPLDAINIRNGGLGIPGAVIAGGLALYIYSRRRKQNFLVWADIAAPGLALGQAIGRWGNFFNQELYGPPSNLPWAIFIEPQYRLPGYESIERYHPVFLYESLWNLLIMALLLWISRRYADRLKNGDLMLMYLIGYPLGRFLLEFIRLDSAELAGLNANQTLMGLVLLLAAGILIWRHVRSAPDKNGHEAGQDPSTADTENGM